MKTLHPFAGTHKNRSWFWWGINIGIFLAVCVWWWLKNQSEKTKMPNLNVTKSLILPDDEPTKPKIILATPEKSKTAKPGDDLTVIKGIGPKSAQALNQAGINTYKKLAQLDSAKIEGILASAGVRIVQVTNWVEQAAQLAGK